MSKIQIAELQELNSELSLLSDRETGTVIGGHRKRYFNFEFTNIVQINNNVNVQVSFGGDNFNVSVLSNDAGAS
ncbi:hypothetical protein [Pleurocapsa sp. PCC 7319]|uniref:hypothetical protein n=1 Tax=Pleurocapsa sp. PCC 7319 TaxID=118161 RepID=UPI00034BABAD|nr:hypothetical protein [Pleurocapsa sp. PCC 7319]